MQWEMGALGMFQVRTYNVAVKIQTSSWRLQEFVLYTAPDKIPTSFLVLRVQGCHQINTTTKVSLLAQKFVLFRFLECIIARSIENSDGK